MVSAVLFITFFVLLVLNVLFLSAWDFLPRQQSCIQELL